MLAISGNLVAGVVGDWVAIITLHYVIHAQASSGRAGLWVAWGGIRASHSLEIAGALVTRVSGTQVVVIAHHGGQLASIVDVANVWVARICYVALYGIVEAHWAACGVCDASVVGTCVAVITVYGCRNAN